MAKFKKIVDKAAYVAAIISYIMVAILVLLNVADVVATKLFQNSISGAYEISECVLMVGVFAAFAYGQTQKTHVHMTLFIDKLPARGKYLIYMLGHILSTVMCGLLTYAMGTQTVRELTGHTTTGILKIPYWPFYLLSVIAMAIFTFTLVYDIVDCFLKMIGKTAEIQDTGETV